MGSGEISNLGERQSFAFIGTLGKKDAVEKRGQNGEEVSVTRTFDFSEYDGGEARITLKGNLTFMKSRYLKLG